METETSSYGLWSHCTGIVLDIKYTGVALAWKLPWMEEPGRLQSVGSLRVRHDWVTSLSLFTFMHWRRKWQPTPVFLPGESQGWGSLAGCRLWGHTESDTTGATLQQHMGVGASLVAQMVKNLPARGRPGFNPWVGKVPWRRVWQPTPVFLPGESSWTEEPGRPESMGLKRVRHDWATQHCTYGHWINWYLCDFSCLYFSVYQSSLSS